MSGQDASVWELTSLWIVISRKASKEADMYDPFVQACNYALEQLSRVRGVDGLPEFSEDERIVFARHDSWPVHSTRHQRQTWLRPDIVLLGWNSFKKWRGTLDNDSYSRSYNDDICISREKPPHELTWNRVRSTLEMKIAGLPKSGECAKGFSMGFGDLKELDAFVPPQDDPEPEVFDDFDEINPASTSERTPFAVYLVAYLARQRALGVRLDW